MLALNEKLLRKGLRKQQQQQQKRSRQDSLPEEGKVLIKRLRTESESSVSGKLSAEGQSAEKVVSGKQSADRHPAQKVSSSELDSTVSEVGSPAATNKVESKRSKKKRKKEAREAEMSTSDKAVAEAVESMQVEEEDDDKEDVKPAPLGDNSSETKVTRERKKLECTYKIKLI